MLLLFSANHVQTHYSSVLPQHTASTHCCNQLHAPLNMFAKQTKACPTTHAHTLPSLFTLPPPNRETEHMAFYDHEPRHRQRNKWNHNGDQLKSQNNAKKRERKQQNNKTTNTKQTKRQTAPTSNNSTHSSTCHLTHANRQLSPRSLKPARKNKSQTKPRHQQTHQGAGSEKKSCKCSAVLLVKRGARGGQRKGSDNRMGRTRGRKEEHG